MVLINTSSSIGFLVNNVGAYVFGDVHMVGVWLLILIFGVGAISGLDLTLLFVLTIPITIVLIATNYIFGFVGGLFILLAAIVLAKNFFFR